MTAKLRIAADTPDEAREILRRIGAVLDTASNGKTYDNRSGFGCRMYAEVRVPTTATPDMMRAWAERIDRAAIEQGDDDS